MPREVRVRVHCAYPGRLRRGIENTRIRPLECHLRSAWQRLTPAAAATILPRSEVTIPVAVMRVFSIPRRSLPGYAQCTRTRTSRGMGSAASYFPFARLQPFERGFLHLNWWEPLRANHSTGCGFSVIERIEVPTSSGVTVPCARMIKLRALPHDTESGFRKSLK